MRFMILVKATATSEAGTPAPPALLDAMAAYQEQLVQAGVLLDAHGLQPSRDGWRIRHEHGHASLQDGPFAAARDLVAGYAVIQVRSREEALEWSRRFPAPSGPDAFGEIEVRPMHEPDDLAPGAAPARPGVQDARDARGR